MSHARNPVYPEFRDRQPYEFAPTTPDIERLLEDRLGRHVAIVVERDGQVVVSPFERTQRMECNALCGGDATQSRDVEALIATIAPQRV